MESILNSIKKLLGVSIEDTSFDVDIISNINSVLMILNQLGVGPTEGFFIKTSETKWSDYVTNVFIAEAIKTYVYLKVKLVFDPPTSTSLIEAMKGSALEYEWRIQVWAESNTTTQ